MSKFRGGFILSALMLAAFTFFGTQAKKELTAYQLSGIGEATDTGRNRILLWVYNSDDVAHENGDVVVYKDGSLVDGLEISTTTTANNALVAGVVAPRTIAAATWGFIQTHGYHSAITCDTSVSAGDTLITSGTGEATTSLTVLISTSTSPEDDGAFATALADDSSSLCKGFIFR